VLPGGGSGIGLMATQALAMHGAKVYIVGRSQEKLDKVVETYGKNIPGEIIALNYDVSRKDQIDALYQDFSSREKCLCILINNAGIGSNTFETKASTPEEMKQNLFLSPNATFEEWTSVYQSLVPQVFFMTTAFLPLLAHSTERHPGYSGTVINIASVAGMIKSAQHHFAYSTAKAATIHLSRLLSSEIADNGFKIRVNSISPGVFPSELTTGESDDTQKSRLSKGTFEGRIPAGRPGKDEDIASTILFCAANQYLNGQNVVVDGGYTLAAGM
jgi:NAD(P)-dependent dehydrogenase (short-subunit alcohol dehydrogenase family)